MKHSILSDPVLIARAAEARMKQWLIAQELVREKGTLGKPANVPRKPQFAVTISREAGLDGAALGEEIASRLGWEMLDRQLLDYMAQKYKLPRDMLEFVDETSANWLYDYFWDSLGSADRHSRGLRVLPGKDRHARRLRWTQGVRRQKAPITFWIEKWLGHTHRGPRFVSEFRHVMKERGLAWGAER
ncbi:MAG: cytidylate kinase family protein [Planctomycetota bacterium]